MPTGLPVHRAIEVARTLFAFPTNDGAPPSQERFIDAIREFEGIEFDVPTITDADGFLFQLGSVNWLPEPTFILGITRQLEVVDSEGEHESYLQVAMDFHYPLDGDLSAIESASSWWFRNSSNDFSGWLQSVENHRIWQRVSDKAPREFVISADEV